LVQLSGIFTPSFAQNEQLINLADIRSLRLSLPPVATQRAVAEVLGALDDKISSNRHIARIAGELADRLFTQVLVTSEVALKPFKEIARIGGGGTPRTSEPSYWDGDIPWVTPTDVTALAGPYLARTERTISQLGLEACSSPLYPIGSILMTSRATIGAFAIADVPVAVNQGFIVVHPFDPGLNWWIFHDMSSRVDEFKSHANGATFMELSRGRFKDLSARLTDVLTMRSFSERASALHASARQALRESVTLAKLRDTLLPQLMSGRLRVREAEKQVEAVD
jgi:type I restriction enzyme S subunit